MTSEEDFYITLLSNSSSAYFPDNKTTHFCTQLPKTIQLRGDWEVGITEFQYPFTMLTVNQTDAIIYFKLRFPNHKLIRGSTIFKTDPFLNAWMDSMSTTEFNQYFDEIDVNPERFTEIVHKTRIPSGNYGSVEALISTINQNENFVFLGILFDYDKSGNVLLKNNTTHSFLEAIYFSDKLGLQLGYEPKTNIFKKPPLFPPNLKLVLPSQFFIYCDIIEPQIIGDIFSKVLRVVSVDTAKYTYGAQECITFIKPDYVNVLKREFDNLEIDIRTATGDPVLFQFGIVCMKLHFRKRTINNDS